MTYTADTLLESSIYTSGHIQCDNVKYESDGTESTQKVSQVKIRATLVLPFCATEEDSFKSVSALITVLHQSMIIT